jgi:hypothetical protein
MKKIIKFLFFVSFLSAANAQNDTVYIKFPAGPDNYSLIRELVLSTNDQVIALHGSPVVGNEYVYRISKQGEVLDSVNIVEVGVFDSLDIRTIVEKEGGFFLAGRAVLNDIPYFITFSMSSDFQSIELIDSTSIIQSPYFTYFKTKFNPHKQLWETCGTILENNVNPFDFFYIGMDESFHIQEFKVLGMDPYYVDFVLDFYYQPESKRYLLANNWMHCHALLDDDKNYIKTPKLFYSYQIDDTTFHNIRTIRSFVDESDGKPLIYCADYYQHPMSVAILKLDIQEDTVIVDEIHSLNTPNLGIKYGNIMKRDYDGNIVFSGTTAGVYSPNSLILAKFDANYERIWYFSYEDYENFRVFDIEIDQDNNIYIAGSIPHLLPNGDRYRPAFLMKISAAGTLSSVTKLPDSSDATQRVEAYPNPVRGQVCLSGTEKPVRSVLFWGIQGQLMHEINTPAGVTNPCFVVPPDLPSGQYVLEVRYADDTRSYVKVVVP